MLRDGLPQSKAVPRKDELASFETDIAALVRNTEESIAEADSFIRALEIE